MRIGELARRVGVSTDTVRFYERSGWLPKAERRENAYRDYGESDVEHLRLLIELRRLDVPLDSAATIAGWCHSGHCGEATAELPRLIGQRRADVAERIAGLQSLDARLAALEQHIAAAPRSLAVLDSTGPCCDTAAAVVSLAEGGCTCCTSTSPPAN
jgi:DNA-binding transcriptional MerR regulator